MASRTLPGLGLTGFWNEGDPWKTGGDQNWLKLSAVTQLAVKSATTSLPGTPADGDIYIVPEADANGNSIAVRDNGAWAYLTPKVGWLAHVEDTSLWLEYDGSAWVEHMGDRAKLSGAMFSGPVGFKPTSSAAPDAIGDLVFELSSDTQLTIKVMGSDGIIRSTVLTLT